MFTVEVKYTSYIHIENLQNTEGTVLVCVAFADSFLLDLQLGSVGTTFSAPAEPRLSAPGELCNSWAERAAASSRKTHKH